MIDPRSLGRRLDEVRHLYAGCGIEVTGLAEHAALLADLAAFADCLDATRAAALLDQTRIGQRIPEAAEELEAIVTGTAEATDAILSTCEQLDAAVAGLPDMCSGPVLRATARIFEACSFQDITGQRAAKVGQVLKLIDGKVALIESALSAAPMPVNSAPSASLMNGPQRGAHGMDQCAVDALFGSIP